jgi:hypothetical protein
MFSRLAVIPALPTTVGERKMLEVVRLLELCGPRRKTANMFHRDGERDRRKVVVATAIDLFQKPRDLVDKAVAVFSHCLLAITDPG